MKTVKNDDEANQQDLKDQLITRKQCKDFFQVTYVTLFNWKKRGILVPISIGGKVYYKKESILKLLNHE